MLRTIDNGRKAVSIIPPSDGLTRQAIKKPGASLNIP